MAKQSLIKIQAKENVQVSIAKKTRIYIDLRKAIHFLRFDFKYFTYHWKKFYLMKKLYLLSLGLISALAFSQQIISFEASEAYNVGNISGQNGWTVTESSDGLIENQVISNAYASEGSFSFKNAYEATYGGQIVPIIGAQKDFSQALNYKNSVFSFDAYITETQGSNFEIATYGIQNNEFVPIFDLLFNYDGTIQVLEDTDFDFLQTSATWEANKWYTVKVEVSENNIKYYLDNLLIATVNNFTKIDLQGMNFLHDNYGGDAYFDNIIYNSDNLAVNDATKGNIKLYPNPVKDILKLNLPNGEKISTIEVYNTLGQKVSDFSNVEEINLTKLKAGVYIINLKNNQGKTYTSKIVKQ